MYVAEDLDRIGRAEHIYKSLTTIDKYEAVKKDFVYKALEILRISKAMDVIVIYDKLNLADRLNFKHYQLESKIEELDSVFNDITEQDEAISEIGLCPCCNQTLHKG